MIVKEYSNEHTPAHTLCNLLKYNKHTDERTDKNWTTDFETAVLQATQKKTSDLFKQHKSAE